MDPIKMFEDVFASTEMKKYFAKVTIESELKAFGKSAKGMHRDFLEALDEEVTLTVEEKTEILRKLSSIYNEATEEVIRELKAEAYDEQQAEEGE
ncbi:hypothetical protein BCV50_00140 [Bacillus subtilis]|nr:hypothetical protein BCV50_00140 [Bacillus subtilis]